MQSIVSDYLNNFEPFQLFGLSHWVSIVLFFFLLFFLPWFAINHLSNKHQRILGTLLVSIVFINYPIWVILELIAGSFDSKLHLPLHLCRFANLLLPLAIIFRNIFIFQILFYWGLSAMFQAIFTPDINHDFPHFHYFRYFAGHHLLVITVVYAVFVYGMKPTLNGMKHSFIALNIFLIIAFIFNIILDANYFWVMGKPPVSSLLDFMGPWPWYIITAELVTLLHFIFVYNLYKYFNKKFKLIHR